MDRPYKRHLAKPAASVKPLAAGAPRARTGQVVTRADLERAAEAKASTQPGGKSTPREIGGPEGPEPTRYGDWEIKGRCIDF